jgi:hypothetical protein
MQSKLRARPGQRGSVVAPNPGFHPRFLPPYTSTPAVLVSCTHAACVPRHHPGTRSPNATPAPCSSSISRNVSSFPIFSSPETVGGPSTSELQVPHMSHSRFHTSVPRPASLLSFRSPAPLAKKVNSNTSKAASSIPSTSPKRQDYNSSRPSQTQCHPPTCISREKPWPDHPRPSRLQRPRLETETQLQCPQYRLTSSRSLVA